VVGILMCMLVVSLPNIRLYWKKDMVIFAVSKVMCWDRFEEIVSALHLSNNHPKPDRGEARYNNLYKVRKLLDMLNKNFKFNTGMEEVVSIDEKMIPYKGTILLKVFIKNKPSKWGMKIWALASQSGYVNSFIIFKDNLVTMEGELSIGR
jgi:hypothetical protein